MKTKKTIEECYKTGVPELELVEKRITTLDKYDQLGLFFFITCVLFSYLHLICLASLTHLYKLSVAHNKLKKLPTFLKRLQNLEILNVNDNYLVEIGDEIVQIPTLRVLLLGINCLTRIPPSIVKLEHLQVLDLSYNFLKDDSFPEFFWNMRNLRALYLADNDMTKLPPSVGNMEKLEILNLRGNDLTSLPGEMGHIPRLRELNVQGNRLTLLPPEFGDLNFTGAAGGLQLEFNPWMPVLEKKMKTGLNPFFEYLRSAEYRRSYERFLAQLPNQPPERRIEKVSKKKLASHMP